MTRNPLGSVKERLPSSGEHGQVGIGTLIVFIAMVLVAAIAAGVLINTAGFLQTQAEATGEQSSSQVSDSAQVVYASGNVTNSQIDEVNLTVKKAPGSDNINLSKATIQWSGSESAILVGNQSSSIENLSGTEFGIYQVDTNLGVPPVLVDTEDRLSVVMNGTAIESNIGAGETVDLTIVTQSGAQTTYTLTVPESLEEKQTVNL